MKFHTSKLLTIIQYTGDEPKVVRELLTNPLPTVKKDDLLIVPENVGKFLAREGSPFERVDIENFLGNFETNYINQISDDAVATVDKLTQTILELEGQLKIKQDELEGFELRQNDEIEELKKVNQELNEKMELSDDAVATVDKLTQTILELEGQLKIKQDELEGFKLRQNVEMEELKKVNQELNEKMELIQNKTLETNPSDILPVDTIPKTTKKTTTKAPKEETL